MFFQSEIDFLQFLAKKIIEAQAQELLRQFPMIQICQTRKNIQWIAEIRMYTKI